MIQNLPLDLKAESLLSYIPRDIRQFELKGSHKRNAYEDIAGIYDNDGLLNITLARNGLYDILPESMFHPIDRFDNIPANEYKERFKEECELQQIEEENARKYFRPFDNCLMELSTIVLGCSNEVRCSEIIGDIICDHIPETYIKNRFVQRAKEFIPICHRIRGDKDLFSLMLRYILLEEGISIVEQNERTSTTDPEPRYFCTLEEQGEHETFLGNEFEEYISTYNIKLWKEDECNESFLDFIAEIKTFEQFLNDFFMGLETRLRFDISTDSLPVRLADDVFYTYLDYNTNI